MNGQIGYNLFKDFGLGPCPFSNPTLSLSGNRGAFLFWRSHMKKKKYLKKYIQLDTDMASHITKQEAQRAYFNYLKKKTVVYFIESESGLVKIGKSSNPEKRLKALQVANSEKLKIIKIINKNAEKKIQSYFKSERVNGEWFKKSQKMIDFINQYP